jgi:transcriptional regulator with XRE-family HTH domain
MEKYQTGTTRTFAILLRELREKSGLSQAAVARSTGLDTGYLTRCEQGQRVPANVDVVESLAAVLGCSESETDALRIAAGFLPRAIQQLGLDDPELLLLARLLDPGQLSTGTREVLRQVIRSFQPLLDSGDIARPATQHDAATSRTSRPPPSPTDGPRITTVNDQPASFDQPPNIDRAPPIGRRRAKRSGPAARGQ